MKQSYKIQTMVTAALLCAIGVAIPMFCPSIRLEPASFTLASHVPVFIAIFISPAVAASVAVVTGFGFLFAGFPVVVVLRALSHIVFALIGASILKKHENTLCAPKSMFSFGLLCAILHAGCEVLVVTGFYLGNGMSGAYYTQGYWNSVILLVGAGTVVHSMIDYCIAVFVWKHIQSVVRIPVCAKV